jgi:hypothetical protein
MANPTIIMRLHHGDFIPHIVPVAAAVVR